MAGNGGPWGGGGSGGGDRGDGRNEGRNDGRSDGRGDGRNEGRGPARRPGEPGQMPEIDQIMRKGQERLRVLMGGRGGGNGGGPMGSGGPGLGPALNRTTVALGLGALVLLWGFSSFYTVQTEEQSVELFLGEFSAIGNPGLNFAPWPLVTREVVEVTPERTEDVGVDGNGPGENTGLMLTGDENIVDIDFQVVWNVNDPQKYLFNLRDPQLTIRAVSESAMREIIAQTALAPILNTDRASIAARLETLIQDALNGYDSGLNVVRVNLLKADPPPGVIDSFKEVQSAEQQRDRLQKEADAYANRVTAGARGEAAQVLEEAEAYRARVVNEAEGEASRFSAVLAEYAKAPEVTRKRLYLETMEEVLGRVDKVILDDAASGQGVVPFLPLNEIGRRAAPVEAPATAAPAGGAQIGGATLGATAAGGN